MELDHATRTGRRNHGADPGGLVGDHLQHAFVVVAEEQRPLTTFGDGGGLLEDVHDGEAQVRPVEIDGAEFAVEP